MRKRSKCGVVRTHLDVARLSCQTHTIFGALDREWEGKILVLPRNRYASDASRNLLDFRNNLAPRRAKARHNVGISKRDANRHLCDKLALLIKGNGCLQTQSNLRERCGLILVGSSPVYDRGRKGVAGGQNGFWEYEDMVSIHEPCTDRLATVRFENRANLNRTANRT
jgi:hypothetical protein